MHLSSDLGLGARAIEGLPYFRDRMIDFAFHLFGVHDVFVSDRKECKRKDSEWPLSSRDEFSHAFCEHCERYSVHDCDRLIAEMYAASRQKAPAFSV
jgi:hypothetical protein